MLSRGSKGMLLREPNQAYLAHLASGMDSAGLHRGASAVRDGLPEPRLSIRTLAAPVLQTVQNLKAAMEAQN